MNGTEQFVSSLVHALAWPAAVVALALGFRRQITKALGNLIRLRAGPVDMEFERILASAELEVPAEVTPEQRAGSLSAELSGFARDTPATAIIEAARRIELRLRERVEAAGGEPGNAGLVPLARMARDLGVVSDTTLNAIEGLAVLRNLSAHARTGVSTEQALEYLALADGVLYAIEQHE